MGDVAATTTEETLEQMQARHRREAKDLQGRITSKKKNATKKTRKGVNDECALMEREMKERQEAEIRALGGNDDDDDDDDDVAAGEEGATDESGGVEDGLGKLSLNNDERVPLAAKPPQQQQQPSPPSGGGSTTTTPATSQQAGGGAAAAGGKKRNRQKERLARRAAEHAAAAHAAAAEAGAMTDHRAAERGAIEAQTAALGLVEVDVRPDGHCLFSAVADQLPDVDDYRAVRAAAAGYIAAHADAYAGFLEEEAGAYARRIRDTAEWGGQVELSALANAYGVEICVVQGNGGEMEVVRPSGESEGEEGTRKRIWLAYYRHGYGLGEHYNSLRKKE